LFHFFNEFECRGQVLGVRLTFEQNVVSHEVGLLLDVLFVAEFLENGKRFLHVFHQHTAFQEAVLHDSGSALQLLLALREEADDSLVLPLGLRSLDASAEGGNREVVRIDRELHHRV